jgi:RNA polymerase sigma-70 factor, Bacteroides expansion family 1
MLENLFILRKIKEGDINTFEKVFREYYIPLCYYSTSITGRKDIAEEIVQDLFYIIWRDRESLQVYSSLKSYLYGAVRNKSLQYHEHREVQARHEQVVISKKDDNHASAPDENLEYEELEKLIDKTLKSMPERRRKIFKMHRFDKKKYAEIAQFFSISIKTVEAEMTKALQSLRKEIEYYTNTL